MIIGECPYNDCGEVMANPISHNRPSFQRLECPKCHKTVWLYHSVMDPQAFTEQQFQERYKVDPVSKTIRKIAAAIT